VLGCVVTVIMLLTVIVGVIEECLVRRVLSGEGSEVEVVRVFGRVRSVERFRLQLLQCIKCRVVYFCCSVEK
jgi:hypothetical protein